MPTPVVTVPQMREWETITWASGQSEQAVMLLAGQAIARRAAALTQPGDSILVLAGSGHNGDDARFAAEAITDRQVRLVSVTDPEAAGREIEPLFKTRPALIIDGLFGIGLNRPLAAPWIKLIQQINAARLPVLAVDVPSGLDSDTGLPLDDAIRATLTLTLGAVKQGLLKSTAWPFVGRLEVARDIGLVPCPFTTELSFIAPEDFAGFPPPRPPDGHKGTFGHLVIVAGSMGYHGAAVLAARGAQRAQPGLVTLFTGEDVYHPIAKQLQAVMIQPWSVELPLPASATALLIGPGLAGRDLPEHLKLHTRELWQQSPLTVIADASALDWLPPGPCASSALRVITPHPGEAARLLATSVSAVQSDRPGAVRELSRRYGQCQVVLKGHQTLIGDSQGGLSVNCSGNPHLAQGGSGDLLAGYLGGLLAQSALRVDVARTIGYAVWQHGAAADALLATRPNWIVEELAEVLGTASPDCVARKS